MQDIQGMMIEIPQSVENMQLPSPELLTYYENLNNRILWLDEEVSAYTMEYVKQILRFNMLDKGKPVEEREPIKIMFASPGGSLDTCNCLIDTIRHSKTPVWGINICSAQSAACFIYLACNKRLCMPRATFLMHNGSAENITGTYEQVLAFVGEYQRQIEELAAYVEQATHIPAETVAANLASEWYITAEESVELGMTDEIIADIDMIL